MLPAPRPRASLDPHCILVPCLPSDPWHLWVVLAMLVSSAADGFGLASLMGGLLEGAGRGGVALFTELLVPGPDEACS